MAFPRSRSTLEARSPGDPPPKAIENQRCSKIGIPQILEKNKEIDIIIE
jgi:hypothetical protein